MQLKFLSFIYSFLFTFLLVTFGVQAKDVSKFCKKAKNNADLVDCLNKYYEKVKSNQSNVFQEQLESLEEGKASDLRNTQKNWIAYRNSQCEWDADNEENSSLKRITELHCLIHMTEEREKILELAKININDRQQQIGFVPRWENVLSETDTDLYWRRSDHYESDMNCNDQIENTVIGVKLREDNKNQYIIGFVESTKTGRPEVILYELPIYKDKEQDADSLDLCGSEINIEIIEDNNDTEECMPTKFEVQNGDCSKYSISWNEDKFVIAPIENSKSETE